MSISLLLDKYDVSTQEGLQKALNEIELEEAEVDEALSGALSRACALEGRLRAASQAYTKLGEVKNDAQAATDMVERTAALARDVSAKVRQLDLARSRVAECQHRVNDLIDLQLCSAGVEAAIKAHDYETGAAHVARYLSMDPGSVAAARARGESDPRDVMARAANTLRDLLVHKFEEASRKDDDAAISKLFKLFSQVGRQSEGVDLLAKYMARQLESSLGGVSISERSGGCPHADAITQVLESAAAVIDNVRKHANGILPQSLSHIQPVICTASRSVCTSLIASSKRTKPECDVLMTEPVISELALTHSRIMLYFNFLRRKAEADASEMPSSDGVTHTSAVEDIIMKCDLTRIAQDLLTHYLTLERYFLEESVNKALKVSQTADSSSLVDDVFFIARKVIRRAASSSSVEALCTILNIVCAVLERDVCGALRAALRSAPHNILAFPSPQQHTSQIALCLGRDLDPQRKLFLAHMNEAECGAEWCGQLAQEACALWERSNNYDKREMDKLRSCAEGLAHAGAALRDAHSLGASCLKAALAPHALAWAARVVAPTQYADETDDADALPRALDALAEAAGTELSSSTSDSLLSNIVCEIATKAMQNMLHNTYTREEAVVVERRARRLAAWSGGAGGAARERCASLTQAAALLALQSLSHARDVLGAQARVPPSTARDVLSRRVDFKIEDIKRLKLQL